MIPYVTEARYPWRSGHRVQFLIDGVALYSRLLSAIQGAERQIFGAISFLQPGFCFLNGEAFWSTMQEAAARGVSVHLLAWRNPHFFMSKHVFQGTASERAMLADLAPNVNVRWDESPAPDHCHHQKMWLIDDTAFVGGMVLSKSTLDDHTHQRHEHGKHDSFLEFEGPAVLDVYDNFAQRWNASKTVSSHPALTPTINVPSLSLLPKGITPLQLSRTLKPGLYETSGEADIWAQYKLAFAHAKRTIYLENQHPGEEQLLLLLSEAARRGVRVVYLVPGEPMQAISVERREAEDYWRHGGQRVPRYASTFAALKDLANEENFTLAALAHQEPGCAPREIYTHSKLCIVDGEWVTIGSANLVDLSLLSDHTELNVSLWDQVEALRLLRQLTEEHTQLSSQGKDDGALLAQLQRHARENTARRQRNEVMQGHVYALEVSLYGV